MKKSIFLLFLLPYVLPITAQDIFTLLTAHDGYWYHFSQYRESCGDGSCMEKEEFITDKTAMDLRFNKDGLLYILNEPEDENPVEAGWKLISGNMLLLTRDRSVAGRLEILEITDNKLVLKEMGASGSITIVTYCFPNNRLSEVEAALASENGFPETHSVKRLHTGASKLEFMMRPLSEDADQYRVFNPSANSKFMARNVIFSRFGETVFNFPFETERLVPAINWEGIKTLEIVAGNEKRVTFYCDKNGNIIRVDEPDGETVQFSYKNDIPVSMSGKDFQYNWYMGENFIFLESENKDTRFLFEYENNDKPELTGRHFWRNTTTLDFTNEYFDTSTKCGFLFDYGNEGDWIEKYTFHYSNNGIFPFEITRRKNYWPDGQTYLVDKTDNLLTIGIYNYDEEEEEEYEKESQYPVHTFLIYLNEKGNLQKIDSIENDRENKRISETLLFDYMYY